MIGLPNRVRACRLAPVNQIEFLAVSLGALMGQHQKIGRQPAHDAINHPVAGRFFSAICG